MSPKQIERIQKWLIEPFLDFFPLVFGAIIVWTRFVESTSLFFDALFGFNSRHLTDCSPDLSTIGIWSSILFWTLVNYRTKMKKDKEADEKLRARLARLPNFGVLPKARKYIDSTNESLFKLTRYEQEFKSKNYTNIAELKATLFGIHLLTKKITSDFYNVDEEKIGLNFMIYIRNEKNSNKVIDKILSDSGLYMRSDKKDNLNGVLCLFPELNDPVDKSRELSKLSIPVYEMSSKVYNSPDALHKDDITIPGAPMAFFQGNNMIADTKDRTSYGTINKETQDEMIKYFEEIASETRCLMSFRIPKEPNERDFIGVLNIEASETSSFNPDENYFNTFYSIIYPVLSLTSKYLRYFRAYKISILKSA